MLHISACGFCLHFCVLNEMNHAIIRKKPDQNAPALSGTSTSVTPQNFCDCVNMFVIKQKCSLVYMYLQK